MIDGTSLPRTLKATVSKVGYIYNFLFLEPTDIDTSLAALRKAGLDVPLRSTIKV
jgi:hypothetical protein